ncbi:MAG: carbohydrate binding family 9 domain-containing protein, partial [Pseudohongiellaceae bacterium]
MKIFQRTLVLLLCLSQAAPVLAQPPAGRVSNGDAPVSSAERKSIEIVRTELTPKIDGILDDELWRQATVLSDMHQFQPVDHGQPTEKSEFYLAYSERFLYVAARLYDSNPELISARQMVQGGNMPFDDAFEFILDTFNNRRTGYSFQVNPNGIRREGVYENPNNLNNDWNGIWLVESRIDEQGWTAEVAIPFNTLNFNPNSSEWGFTIARTIARNREEIAWSSFNRNINPSTTGLLTGIRNIRQGVGLDVIPSLGIAVNTDYVSTSTADRGDP